MPALQHPSGRPALPVRWLTSLLGGLLLALILVLAQAQQTIPALSGHIIDHSATLDTTQRQQLEDKLAAFEQRRGAQIVLLLVPTTQPEDIVSYANRVANNWKIGRRDVGDGLLLIVAKNDHKVRIEVAKTLEGAIPDLAAKRVIDQAITPHFKQGDFAGGLNAAADQIMALIGGETLPAPKVESVGVQSGFEWQSLAVLLFFGVPMVAGIVRRILGSKLGALATGGIFGTLALMLTASLLIASLAAVGALLFSLFSSLRPGSGTGIGSGWRTGGTSWGSGSSSGGFSSGGGGDFGGGGASGDW